MGAPSAARMLGSPLAAELVARNCALRPYTPRPAPQPITVAGELIAYASPDSTFAVTRELLGAARESILVGIYDFTAGYVADLLLAAAARGVEVTVMLDLDDRKGEPELWDALARGGCRTVPAPSCASAASRYFPSCHEKVIVIDAEWCLVQSGNWSEGSIPRNEADGRPDPGRPFVPGNRDMGIAVRSRELAEWFGALLRSDIELEVGGGAGAALEGLAAAAPAVAAAPERPPVLFASLRLTPAEPIRATPVISPESYMGTVVGLLAGARSSIRLEQQYIRSRQPTIGRLLGAIRAAMDGVPGLDVRVVLGAPYGAGDTRTREDIERLADHGLEPGRHVRLLDPRHFVHCHNKLVAVDGERVLVGSQNWSDFAVTRNREAGLLLESAALAGYYGEIFDADWAGSIALDALPAALDALEAGSEGTVPLRPGDFAEV